MDTPRRVDYLDTAQSPERDPENTMNHGRLSDSDKIDEILARMRRTETRLTRLAIAAGVETRAQQPHFDNGKLFLPSPGTALKDCLNSIPKDWLLAVQVFIGDELIAVLDPVGNRSKPSGV